MSDLEVAYRDVDDALTTVRYPLADGSGSISIATVRPTILGRRRTWRCTRTTSGTATSRRGGRSIRRARVPIVADCGGPRSDRALKITGTTDRLRDRARPRVAGADGHRLDGRMNEHAGDLAGATQEEAETRILEWLRERDQLEHGRAIGTRWATANAPGPDRAAHHLQWYVNMKELAAPAARGDPRGQGEVHASEPGRRDRLARENPPPTSRGSSGGAAISPRGTARTATPPWPRASRPPARSAGAPSSGRTRTSTPGSRRRSGRLRRSAGPSRRASSRSTTPRTSSRRPATSSSSGCADDDGGRGAGRRHAVPRRDHPLARAGPGRTEDVEEPGHRNRAGRRHRAVRRRCDAVRAPEDVLDPGRALLARFIEEGRSSRTSSGTWRG